MLCSHSKNTYWLLLEFSFSGSGQKLTIMSNIYPIQTLLILQSMLDQCLIWCSYSKSFSTHCWIFLFMAMVIKSLLCSTFIWFSYWKFSDRCRSKVWCYIHIANHFAIIVGFFFFGAVIRKWLLCLTAI